MKMLHADDLSGSKSNVAGVKKNSYRPFTLKMMTFYSFVIAMWNGLRMVQGITFRSILQEYEVRPGPMYIILSGGGWFLISLVLTWGIWQKEHWAWLAAIIFTFLYFTWYWADRLVLQISHTNWMFSLGVTLILMGIPLILLFSRETRQSFSKDNYERKSKS